MFEWNVKAVVLP